MLGGISYVRKLLKFVKKVMFESSQKKKIHVWNWLKSGLESCYKSELQNLTRNFLGKIVSELGGLEWTRVECSFQGKKVSEL